MLLPLFTIRLTTNFTLIGGRAFSRSQLDVSYQLLHFPSAAQFHCSKKRFSHFESKTIEKEQPKHSDSGLDSNREDESFKSVDNSCLESDKVSIDLLTCTNVPVALHKYEKSKSIMPTEYSQKSTEFQK